ncbi:MAG: DsbA family protein [Nitrospinaceae bacterium]
MKLPAMHRSFRLFGFLILWGILIFPGTLVSQALADTSGYKPFDNDPLLAIVDGEPVLMDDVKNAQIHDAMLKLHSMQRRALKEFILKKLVNKHPELDKQPIPEVTRDDIIQFYNGTSGVKELGTLKQMEKEIREYLERSFRESFVEQRFQRAVKKGWVKVFLKSPPDFKLVAGVNTAMLWFQGKEHNAKRVFLLEYSDFQCPFCKRVQSTLNKLRKRYAKEVQFGYRHFPLPFHKGAKFLAEAVECARDQGRFWELQAVLYKISDPAGPKNIADHARRAGVKNLKGFQTCVSTAKYRKRVLNDIRDGSQLGIQGTPTFILGLYDSETGTVSGEMMSGAVSEDRFSRVIEKYLSASRAEANLVR